MNDEAFQKGFDSFCAKDSDCKNPYLYDTPEYHAFMDGWDEAYDCHNYYEMPDVDFD